MNLYKKNYVESTSIEITNLTKANIIFSLIYKHPKMDLNKLNCYYLNRHLEKLVKKNNKTVFLLDDFNVALLKHEPKKQLMNSLTLYLLICFYLTLSHHLELPPIEILLLTIYFSIISQKITSGNLTSVILDHLLHFIIAPHIFLNASDKKFKHF